MLQMYKTKTICPIESITYYVFACSSNHSQPSAARRIFGALAPTNFRPQRRGLSPPAQTRSPTPEVYGSGGGMGRTCYARSESEQDERQKEERGRSGGRGATCHAVSRCAASTTCPTRGPPLSSFEKDNGGVPQGSSIVFFRRRSVWGYGGHTFLGGLRGKPEGA